MLNFKQVEDYHRDGYVLVESLFTPEEIENMIQAVETGGKVASTARAAVDTKGKKAKLAIWFDLGEDIWSAASTCPRVVNSVRILLGEDAAFFHGKVMLKEAHAGGAWEWHQDYGYWYGQGFMFPNMISVFVALDEATIENGCLRVLKGSHKLGRVEHDNVAGQVGSDPTRMKEILEQFELVNVTMKPGTALFFHSNTLHSSQANDSDKHRRSFIMCYSAVSNPQITEEGLIWSNPCPVGDDEAILK
jgi:ectoine hydroxylase-related dioxygenase (phytanoyl-CoA dioxygenase family)